MQRKWLTWVLLIISILFVISVIRSWSNLSERSYGITATQEKLDEVKREREELERQLARVESLEYVEKEARNKLNLGKEGELVVLIPSISPFLSPTPTPIDTSPNWEKWVKIFF